MSLLTQASLVLTPNAVKASKLYSIIPSNGNGDMTVVRATTATRVNSSGLIESVAANVPRLNYDGGCPSILVEPQRTNLYLYSEDFNNLIWSKQLINVTTDNTASPDGLINADKVIPNTSNGFHYVRQTVNVTNEVVYTFSGYFKSAGYNFLLINTLSGSSSGNVGPLFNLSNGTLIGSLGGVTYNAQIISVGNGWYRISFSFTTSGTSVAIDMNLLSTNSITVYSGDGTSGIYIWGAQLELGSYLTSYISTVATSVTRNADVITRNNIYTNGLITSTGGTWFIELNNNLSLTRDSVGNGIWIGDNNTTSTAGNSLNIRHNGGAARLNINKCIAGSLTGLYATITNTIKIAIDWNGTTADIFVNGLKVVTGTAFTTTNMEFLNTSAVDVQKYIKSMMLFPKPLTDSECIALTTL